MVASVPNNPPAVVIVTIPDPPRVHLNHGIAGILLYGGLSDDGDGGTQGLSFLWEKLSGPSGDSFIGTDDPLALLLFTQVGLYSYRLTVDDGQPVNSTDSTTVTVEVVTQP